ncbi:MAG: hypothetical protein R8J94_17340 [Acidimicrobiia bacterium]|nr:hypothetical protein [Acidimicrobiia bacterium]
MIFRRALAVSVLILLALAIPTASASATTYAAETARPNTDEGTLMELEQVDLFDGGADQFRAVSETGDDGERRTSSSPASTTRRLVIGGGGVLFATFLAVQQARSRLQTKDPDTL